MTKLVKTIRLVDQYAWDLIVRGANRGGEIFYESTKAASWRHSIELWFMVSFMSVGDFRSFSASSLRFLWKHSHAPKFFHFKFVSVLSTLSAQTDTAVTSLGTLSPGAVGLNHVVTVNFRLTFSFHLCSAKSQATAIPCKNYGLTFFFPSILLDVTPFNVWCHPI